MSTDKTHSLTVCLAGTEIDEISFELWELGVLGIQELPENDELYAPQIGTEFREPERLGDWTQDEKLITTANSRLVVFVNSSQLNIYIDFFKNKNIKVLKSEEIVPESYLEKYRDSVSGKYFGDGFWIGPPWAQVPQNEDSIKHIVIDPGMAFGTGEHPTTQMCFESIWNHKGENPSKILDLGTGSGILALAACKWIPEATLWALDTDPYADAEIKKNLALNPQINAEKIHSYCGETGFIDKLQAHDPTLQFDWVLSNIYGEVLARLEPHIRSVLKSKGLWIATGILDGAARQAFENAALKNFDVVKISERRDAAPNDSLLWLCYELRSR